MLIPSNVSITLIVAYCLVPRIALELQYLFIIIAFVFKPIVPILVHFVQNWLCLINIILSISLSSLEL
jgi:hypothetical protein